jgi:hypothetical protein
MRKPTAAAGSAAFFVLAPGVVAGLVPWWLTGWQVRHPQPSWAWVLLACWAAPARCASVPYHAGYAERDDHAPTSQSPTRTRSDIAPTSVSLAQARTVRLVARLADQ